MVNCVSIGLFSSFCSLAQYNISQTYNEHTTQTQQKQHEYTPTCEKKMPVVLHLSIYGRSLVDGHLLLFGTSTLCYMYMTATHCLLYTCKRTLGIMFGRLANPHLTVMVQYGGTSE